MPRRKPGTLKLLAAVACALATYFISPFGVSTARAGVGDPQVKTDHPWYPGELSCSTFDRLFKTQAQLYQRVTGRDANTDEDKVLASWYWRNLNYDHCTEATQDLWGTGLGSNDTVIREYWSTLFGYGFGICYETHAQWNGEMTTLLGPGRSRDAGVDGHVTFEVLLKGGPYGNGQWALLDQDISTVIFDPTGQRLLGLMEISNDMSLIQKADRSRGWLIGGLYKTDPSGYDKVSWVGQAGGYAGAPPIVHLRSGESLRRYVNPGLEDGKTFVFWGIDRKVGGVPGPQRERTWVNQPEKMYKSTRDCGYHAGQARYGNAVYTYKPDFASGKYKDGVIDEGDDHVTFEWYSPYIVAATPPQGVKIGGEQATYLYKNGCTGGLILSGKMTCPVDISTDQGQTWQKIPAASDGIDLTDAVKGHHQYWIRFDALPKTLADTGLTITTVCQCNFCLIPHLKDGDNHITFDASGNAILDAGPNKAQEQAHVIAGTLGSDSSITLQVQTPHGQPAVHLYVAAREGIGSPPPDDFKMNVDYSTDGGKQWQSFLKDVSFPHAGPHPDDYWSDCFCQGDIPLDNLTGPVQVRFTNNRGKPIKLAEAHLIYKTDNSSPLNVTFAWKDSSGQTTTAEHTYTVTPGQPDTSWTLSAGQKPQTLWVQYACP